MSTEDSTNNADDPVAQLVGDGKRYKTVQDLAKARIEADLFIEQLKTENAGLRDIVKAKEQTSKTDDYETFIAKLREGTSGNTGTKQQDENQVKQPVSMDDVERYLTEREKSQKAAAAFGSLRTELSKIYGDKADEVLVNAMKEHNLSEDMVRTLASSSPKAAMGALGFLAPPKSSTSLAPSVDSEAFLGSKPETRNWNFYRELEKKLGPTGFYDPKIQKQLFKDRMALGDEFWSKA
jgi:hypothetical protein